MVDETDTPKPKKEPRAADPPLGSPLSTFVVRFWRDWSAAEPRWCCRVEHMQSSRSATFMHLDGLLDFIRSVGIIADNGDQPTPQK